MVTQDEAMVECIKRFVKVNKKCSANPFIVEGTLHVVCNFGDSSGGAMVRHKNQIASNSGLSDN